MLVKCLEVFYYSIIIIIIIYLFIYLFLLLLFLLQVKQKEEKKLHGINNGIKRKKKKLLKNYQKSKTGCYQILNIYI